MKKHHSLIFLFLLASGSVFADGKYFETIPIFWERLYPNGGESLYCGDKIAPGDRRYNIEHVFPMAWVARSLKCGSRAHCRKTNEVFSHIESDMHNLFPVRASANKLRGTAAFSELAGEEWFVSDCDFDINLEKNHVEPREAVRGEIARALLYMSDRWRVPLFARQRNLMLKWHKEDPVSTEEARRNQIIRRIQGNSNHWIDRGLVNQ